MPTNREKAVRKATPKSKTGPVLQTRTPTAKSAADSGCLAPPKQPRERTLVPISPLYARYNGSMLGFFLAGALAKVASKRYPVLRRRILDFLLEMEIEASLPEEHKAFVEKHSELSMEVMTAVLPRSRLLCEFALLSSLAMYEAILRHSDPKTAKESHAEAVDLMAKHDLPRSALARFLKAVKPSKTGSIKLDALHTASLNFLRALIEPLPMERKTAFVAMPFHDHFPGLYTALYQPALRGSGYRAIRAWGGLAHEEYQSLLWTLMEKCGVMLADLSTLNLNVLLEVGAGLARENMKVFLVADKNQPDVPSNIADLAVFEYNRNSKRWPEDAQQLLTAQIALAQFALATAPRARHSGKPGQRQP